MIQLNNSSLDNIINLAYQATYYIDITNYHRASNIRLFRLLDNTFKELAVIRYNTNNANAKACYDMFKDILKYNLTIELFAHKLYK